MVHMISFILNISANLSKDIKKLATLIYTRPTNILNIAVSSSSSTDVIVKEISCLSLILGAACTEINFILGFVFAPTQIHTLLSWLSTKSRILF